MGNCQAIDNASLVIQHPCGKVDKLYCPVHASEIMKINPGHYVALLLTTTTFYPSTTTTTTAATTNNNNLIRFTRIKLLRPTDTLVPGHAYRLITTQEVMKGLWAKKYAKKKQSESSDTAATRSELEKTNQVNKHERNRPRTTSSANSAASKSRAWHPSLQSISEAGS